MDHSHRIELDELNDRGLLLHIARHLHRLEELIMSNQSDLDAAVAQLSSVIDGIAPAVAVIQQETTELAAAQTAILAEIQRLNDQIAAGATVDLTALNDLVGRAQAATTGLSDAATALQGTADAVEGIVPPAPPAP